MTNFQPTMHIALSYPLDLSLHLLTQGFGENPELYRQFTVKSLPLLGHNGLDFAPAGSQSGEVCAAAAGTVLNVAFEHGGFGIHVYVQHGGFRTLYAHLRQVLVKAGDLLDTGEPIGYEGSTGFSTGIHLHFGLYPDGEPVVNGYGGAVDPSPFFGEGHEFTPSGRLDIAQTRTPSSPSSGVYPLPFRGYLKPKPKRRRK